MQHFIYLSIYYSQLFVEARKQIFGSLNRESDILTTYEKGLDATGDNNRIVVNDGNIPEWAQGQRKRRKMSLFLSVCFF